jgi:hypothetical protein
MPLWSAVLLTAADEPSRRHYGNMLAVTWRGKRTVTFSDARTFVHRNLWRHWIVAHPAYQAVVKKYPPHENVN